MPGDRVVLPIFPLGVVLFPGMVLPLMIFEERYRTLMHDLLAQPEGARRFGVVAIRQGHEVGADSIQSLYEVGTLATVTRVTELPDGRFDIVTVGTERFWLHELDHSKVYLQAEVELFDEATIAAQTAPPGPHVPGVVGAFRNYVATLGAIRGDDLQVPELPSGAPLLSWLVAAAAVVDLPVRQELLEIVGTAERLETEISLLRTETNLLKKMGSAPAPYLVRAPQHPN